MVVIRETTPGKDYWMIAYLEGKIHSLKPTEVIVNTGGVGYLVHIPLSTYDAVQGAQEARLHIHTVVREDAITLYGFSEMDEKEMFELLISISGIGPKSALGLLSGIRGEDLKNAIAKGDVNRLVAVPGVGKKTAERIVLELKSKVDQLAVSQGESGYQTRSEAAMALAALGYNQRHAEKAVRDILDENPALALEEVIRAALKKLSS